MRLCSTNPSEIREQKRRQISELQWATRFTISQLHGDSNILVIQQLSQYKFYFIQLTNTLHLRSLSMHCKKKIQTLIFLRSRHVLDLCFILHFFKLLSFVEHSEIYKYSIKIERMFIIIRR